MYKPDHVKTSPDFPIPETMRAWVLGDPGQLTLTTKPVPVPKGSSDFTKTTDSVPWKNASGAASSTIRA